MGFAFTPSGDCGCCGTCFKLVRCDDTTIVLYSTSNLAAYVGHTVKINSDAVNTWTVYSHTPTSDCSSPTAVTVDTDVSSTPCLCYRLDECNVASTIYSRSDLSAYVGRVIHRSEDSKFYTVQVSATCIDPVTVTATANYDDCDDANQDGSECSNCTTGTTPFRIRIRVPAGTLTNNAKCSCCTAANGRSYDCVQSGTSGTGACEWLFACPTDDGDLGCLAENFTGTRNFTAVVSVVAQLFFSGGHYFLGASVQRDYRSDPGGFDPADCDDPTAIGGNDWQGNWQADLGTSKPDCSTFSDLQLDYIGLGATTFGCGAPSGGPIFATSL